MTLKERISDYLRKVHRSNSRSKRRKRKRQEARFAGNRRTLDSGQEIQTDAEAFAVGVSVFVVNDEGEQIPLPDGDYTLADGSMLVVAEGAVSESKTKPATAEVDAEEDEGRRNEAAKKSRLLEV